MLDKDIAFVETQVLMKNKKILDKKEYVMS